MRIVSVLLLMIVICSLGACGRMNSPVAPENAVYRRTYY